MIEQDTFFFFTIDRFQGKTVSKTLCLAKYILSRSKLGARNVRNAFENLRNVLNIRTGNIDPHIFEHVRLFFENPSTSRIKPSASDSGKMGPLQLGSRDQKFPKNIILCLMGYNLKNAGNGKNISIIRRWLSLSSLALKSKLIRQLKFSATFSIQIFLVY